QTLARDPSIARATLHTLAQLQGKQTNALREEEPGKILHEHRSDPASQAELSHWGFPYFGSVDSTPLFLILAGRYLRRTGDTAFLHDLWPNLTAAYGWIKMTEDAGGGYLRYERKNPYGLFHQGWKDGSQDHLRIRPPVAIVEAQGYAYSAYREFSVLAGNKTRWTLRSKRNSARSLSNGGSTRTSGSSPKVSRSALTEQDSLGMCLHRILAISSLRES